MEDQPRCIKANPLSYAMHKKVDDTLDELLEEGVIEPVKFSEYACIMVAVNKSDDKARDCGNYILVRTLPNTKSGGYNCCKIQKVEKNLAN